MVFPKSREIQEYLIIKSIKFGDFLIAISQEFKKLTCGLIFKFNGLKILCIFLTGK